MNALLKLMNEAIADNERAAWYAMEVGGNGIWTEQTSGVICLHGVEGMDGLVPVGDLRLSRHMVRNSPVRVLRRVAGYRKLLAMHGVPHQCTTSAGNGVWVAEHPDEGFWIEGSQVTLEHPFCGTGGNFDPDQG